MNNVWEIAINMENEGIEFYTQLANKTENEELGGVFKFLASQEVEHKNFFESLNHCVAANFTEKQDAVTMAKRVFKKIAPQFKDSDQMKNAVDAYKKAITFENNAIKYYSTLVEKAETEKQKKIIRVIINEEKKHAVTLDYLIDFVNRPNEWLEDAEINHSDEY